MEQQNPIIQLKGLGKQFKTTNGTVTALDDINLDIYQGEIFGIIGLSGAGKSTLVRCINYLETPTSGSVIFEGVNLGGKSPAVIRKARKVVMIMDLSKVDKNLSYTFATLKDIDVIITDKKPSPELMKEFQNAGVELVY